MRRSPALRWFALCICGLTVGYVAWPGTIWGGALSILLPFMCGLQSTRLRALAVSTGYYLGALGPCAISGLMVTQGVDEWERLASACLVLGFSATAWSSTGGHHPSTFGRFLTLLGVWFATLVTPMGGWGLAHPSLGWLFIGKGGMGALTFVTAGVLTSFLVAAIRREIERSEPVSVISGRSLAAAICATVILGGSFDQTAAPSHAGPVAVVSASRSSEELKRHKVQREQALRLEVLLGKLALVNQHHQPIQLVVTPLHYFKAKPSQEREAVLHELRIAVARHKIGLVVPLIDATSGPLTKDSPECTAILPRVMTIEVTFRNRMCQVEVITVDLSARANRSKADERAALPKIEVSLYQWPQDEPKPFLELWSALTDSSNLARFVIFSAAHDTPLNAQASRFGAKHVIGVARAMRFSALANSI